MTAPKSFGAYNECEDYFARAAANPHGVAITLSDPGLATRFRQKMNIYRQMLRKQAKRTYEPDDPRYGVSVYDDLQLTVDKANLCRVLIKRYSIKIEAIEDLGPDSQ